MAKQRVQVQGLGEAPTVQPVDLPSFQYGITQRKAGTNKLLQLADDLQKVGMIGKQYSQLQGIQDKIGAEQAEAVAEQDIINEVKNLKDVDRFSILATSNRDRAYRDALLKRHVNNTLLPNLQAKAIELVDVEKYKNTSEFDSAVDAEISNSWQGLVDDIGEDKSNSVAAKALWNAIAPQYKDNLRLKFEKARQDFIENQEEEDLMQELRVSKMDLDTIQNIALNREELMKQQGITDPAARQQILLNSFSTHLNTLITKGKYTDATSFLTLMEMTKIEDGAGKKRRVFGSALAQFKMNTASTAIRSGMQKGTSVSKTTQQQNFAGYYKTALQGLNAMTKYNYQLEPHHLASFRGLIEPLSTELADDPKALEEVIQGIIKSPNPLASLRGKLFELSNSPDAPDLAKELYIGNSAKLEPIEKAVFERPELGINLKPEYKAEQVEEFKEWAALQNTPPTVKDFIEDEAKNYTPWAELEQAGIEAEERGAVLNSTYYKGVNSSIGKMIKNETEASFDELDYIEENVIKEMYLGTSGREFQRSATERIQEALKNAAPEDDKETIKILNELEREEKDRWLRIVNAKKDVANMRPETEVMEGEVSDRAEPTEEIKQVRTKEIRTWGNNLAYKSLMHIKKGAPVSSIKRQVIEDDRKDMETKNLVEQERLSYYSFGLSSYSREGVKKVAALRLDADDVLLFGSLSEAEMKLDEWADILSKDSEGKKLTPEEEKTAEQYIELGIVTADDLVDFGIVQKDLILRPRKAL
tara:strand:- start:9903 stop:12179 length:2277 start_codon:yes stop_codon:yes gene_type:complete